MLQIDIETYSSVDLIKCGVYRYVESIDFEILLFAYAYDDGPVQMVDLTDFEDLPDHVEHALYNPNVIKTAYNANFERICIAKHFDIKCDPLQWRCTAVHALSLGLPGSLGKVAEVLDLEQKKDASGKNLIKYFSVPCKPTKINGGRTRNYPHHDAEKWEQYKAYCIQDVETERDMRNTLDRFPVPDHEWELWALDQRINDSGVKLDQQLYQQAIACDAQYTTRLDAEAKELTGLENPNSLTQLKAWLADRGLETPDGLGKDYMPALIEAAPDEDTRRALKLRREMSKTSVDKYHAMERSMCADERARGLLQFCGANRTWRWAGRLIQVQNLPQNKLPDLELARELLRDGRFELLEMLFGSPSFVLSQLIRTAFIPSNGCRFIVSDFNAIEARVIAWLAGEDWVLDVFQGHGKIYEATAAQMFKVAIDTIVKGHENYGFRAKGKVAVLACIAEGQLVLTDTGLVPIEDVTIQHKVWDGFQWVNHGGIIDKGIKEVITHDGLTATEDHIVWIEGESEPVRFKYAASSRAHLLRSGNGRRPIRLGKNYQLRKEMEKRLERSASFNRMYKLWFGAMDALLQFKARSIKRLPSLLTTKTDSTMVRQEINSGKAEMLKSKRWKLRGLRRAWDSIQFSLGFGGGSLDYPQYRTAVSIVGNGSNRQRWALRAWQYPICAQKSQPGEPSFNSVARMESGRMALRSFSGHTEIIKRGNSGADHKWSKTGCKGQTEELETNRRQIRCYDIVNAGELNRFTVSDVLVHNCGYQGGENALASMDKKREIDPDEYPGLVKHWRKANPNIVKLWYAAERAAVKAVQERRTVKLAKGIQYRYEKGFLFADLPSGRSLAYVNPRIKPDSKFNKDGLVYDGMDQVKKTWGAQRTYGGRLVENLVQGIARDCLAVALVRLDKAEYPMPMHVHDEIISDAPHGFGSVDEMCQIMSEPIDWAPGLPLSAEGFETDFYKKD